MSRQLKIIRITMKYKLVLILVFISAVSFANMANPWREGAKHSLLYTTDNCTVTYEVINIDLLNIYQANYNIIYTISAEEDVTIPLVFLGIGLKDEKNILVNNTQITIIPLTGDLSKFTFLQEKKGRKNLVALKYRESQSLEVDLNDLIYFKAKLKNTQED